MSDDRKHTCSPCLRGFHANCTIPAKCRHLGCPNKSVPEVVERVAVKEKRSSGTSDRRIIERAYDALNHLRAYSHPGLWSDDMTALVHDIEDRLNKERTGTIREPKERA